MLQQQGVKIIAGRGMGGFLIKQFTVRSLLLKLSKVAKTARNIFNRPLKLATPFFVELPRAVACFIYLYIFGIYIFVAPHGAISGIFEDIMRF